MTNKNKPAVWALTPKGLIQARRIKEAFPDAQVYHSAKLETEAPAAVTFQRLSEALTERFHQHEAHIFIMSTGIVVRMIAPLLRHKTKDPAAVVMDELGVHAISLTSGHIGGANALALELAEKIGARPVITTATDINNLPSIDVLAAEHGLHIENPSAIKHVSMAFLTGKKVRLHDPYSILAEKLSAVLVLEWSPHAAGDADKNLSASTDDNLPGIYISDMKIDLPPHILVLRPPSLAVGMGCNRGTDADEMEELLMQTLDQFRLSPRSIAVIASVDIKQDEAGLLALAEKLNLPLAFFDRETLKNVQSIQTPSEMVEKHIGVKSVCEAAAILAAKNGTLIVPKHKTPNVTAAVARMSSIS